LSDDLKKSKVVCAVMAFDFGTARIGVALGNTLINIAHPLTVITGKNKAEKFAKISELINKWMPKLLVIGVPEESSDPRKQELIASIKRFSNRLRQQFKLPVELVDEDYTSAVASNQLAEQGIYGRKQKANLDELAACAILQDYLNRLG
jgi:putative holliday junction resolvase